MPLPSLQSPFSDAAVTPLREHVLPQAAVAALWRGQVIDAVRLVRMEHNVGLQEAQGYVDAYLRTKPVLKSRIEQTQADTREGLLRWFFFLVIGGVGLAYFLM